MTLKAMARNLIYYTFCSSTAHNDKKITVKTRC